jgi:hypothetical protein
MYFGLDKIIILQWLTGYETLMLFLKHFMHV